jgi:2-keto-4-pentenoate hydratase
MFPEIRCARLSEFRMMPLWRIIQPNYCRSHIKPKKPFMIAQTAKNLWEARLQGHVLAADFEGRPTDEAQAYDIQRAMIAGTGDAQVGWKLGATAAAAIKMLELDSVFVGPLFDRFTMSDGASVPLHAAQNPALEVEFSIRLGGDIPYRADAFSRAEVEGAIDAVIPSFEIISGRYARDGSAPGVRIIADGGSNHVSVMGPARRDWTGADLRDHPVTLTINGEQVATGSNAPLLWDHTFDAIAWFANHPMLEGRGLKAGDLIMTGTCTGATPLKAGDRAEADFGILGKVVASFV